MWKRLLKAAHPDVTGDDGALFIWVRSLQSLVAGDHIEEPPRRVRREPPRHTTTDDRISFDTAYERFDSHEHLVAFALLESERMGGVFGRLLGMLHDCYPSVPGDHVLERQERIGPTYRQLAYAGSSREWMPGGGRSGTRLPAIYRFLSVASGISSRACTARRRERGER